MGDEAKRRAKRGARSVFAGAREEDEPSDSNHYLDLGVGWLVSGMGPLLGLALALALSRNGVLARLIPTLNQGSSPSAARAADTYGLIALALAVAIAAIWGAGPGMVALGEGALGLIALALKGRTETGALDGWLVVDAVLLVMAIAAIGLIATRLDQARREVARLKLGAIRERAQVNATLDAAPDALLFFDQSGRVTRANQQARRLLAALRLDAMSGQQEPGVIWTRAGHPLSLSDLPSARALRGEVIREEILIVAPGEGAGASVRRLRLAVSAAPVLGPDGVIAGAVVSARDVSAETAESPLREWPSVWMERMDAFIGMASHEMRTPLTTIKASIQLGLRKLNRTSQPELVASDIRQLLIRADQQVGRMAHLIDDLLDTSRIASGRMALRFEPCDLLALTREAIYDAQLRAPARTIWLEADGEPAQVWGDPGRLSQVIGEYVSNALKFSDASQPVEARVWERRAYDADEAESPGDVKRRQVCVAVRDYGPGVKREALEQVWDRFYQDPDLAARVGSEVGLGLGLYLCRQIIEAHHGQVGVESADGGGARFWLALPGIAD